MNKIKTHVILEGEGAAWDDLIPYYQLCDNMGKICYPTRIQFWTGAFFDKIQVSYDGKALDAHGVNEPGGMTDITLCKDEYIKKIELNYISYYSTNYLIRDLVLYTSKNNKYEVHSWSNESENMKHLEYTIPEGCKLVAIGGKASIGYNCLSGLVVHYECPEDTWQYVQDNIEGVDVFVAEDIINKNLEENYINLIDKVCVQKDIQSLSLSISTDIDGVAMPNMVTATLYDSKWNIITQVENGRINQVNGSLYQMLIENPVKDADYYVKILLPECVHMCYEKQTIRNNVSEETIIAMEEKAKDNKLPYFKRPEIRMAIVAQDPELQKPSSGKSPLAIRWFIYCKLFLASHPALVIAVGIAVLIVSIYILYRTGDKDKSNKKIIDELKKKVQWGKPQKGSGAYYQNVDDFSKSLEVMNDSFYESTKQEFKNWYAYLLKKNNNNLNANSMKPITRAEFESFKIQKFRIDVGGEGCFSFGGIKTGVSDALNINGKVTNSQNSQKQIPALIHINDWEQDKFPINDNCVDTVLMYGCGNPTANEADEIIRCLRKVPNSRIDTSADQNVVEYIKNVLDLYGVESQIYSVSNNDEYPYLSSSDMKIYTLIITRIKK